MFGYADMAVGGVGARCLVLVAGAKCHQWRDMILWTNIQALTEVVLMDCLVTQKLEALEPNQLGSGTPDGAVLIVETIKRWAQVAANEVLQPKLNELVSIAQDALKQLNQSESNESTDQVKLKCIILFRKILTSDGSEEKLKLFIPLILA